MRTKAQVWNELYSLLNFNQYVRVANSYGQVSDGLPNLSYDTYFTRSLKVSKSKRVQALALEGLNSQLTLVGKESI